MQQNSVEGHRVRALTMSHIIADIGGTNARFAIVQGGKAVHETVLKCRDYEDLTDAATAYLDGLPERFSVQNAAIALAGPITGADEFTLTNHPWRFSISQTKKALGVEKLGMFNDFQAVAMSVPHLQDEYVIKVGGGESLPKGNIGVIGPGTGLGVSSLVYDERNARYIAVACEGGHVTMPAKTQREFDIFQWLVSHKYSHVSAERVCSGKGIVNLYRAMRSIDKRNDLPERLEPEEITARALSGECALCAELLDIMLGFLGRVAGNLALTLNAMGGVYIAGGIIPQIGLDVFENSRFREEFYAKGRFKDFVNGIATYVVTDPLMALGGLRAEVENLG